MFFCLVYGSEQDCFESGFLGTGSALKHKVLFINCQLVFLFSLTLTAGFY